MTDEVSPTRGLLSLDLINFIGESYHFSVRPQIPPGMLASLFIPYTFQAGAAEFDDSKIPIYQLVVLTNGDIVQSATTELGRVGEGFPRPAASA
jgi:hypothetical protein